MIKVAFIVTSNQSKEFRPMGFELVDSYLNSLNKYCKYQYNVYFFDNASEEKFELDKYDMPIVYTYIEDQTIRGNTGCWNDGVKMAYEDGYDQIWITNDDVVFNESINDLIDIVNKHEDRDISVWGPTTNGIDPGNPAHNVPDNNNIINLSDSIIDVTGDKKTHVHGFFIGFTREFYEKFKRKDENVFDPDPKYNWGGNESTIQYRIWPMGGKSKIVRGAWLYHRKIRGWAQHVNKESWYLNKSNG